MIELLSENQRHQIRILNGEREDWEEFLAETRGEIIERDDELAQGYASGDLLEEDAADIRVQINRRFRREARIYKVLRKISKEISEIKNERATY